MRQFLKRDIPAGAALAVVVLVLVASVVTGRERARAPAASINESLAPAAPARHAVAGERAAVVAGDLDLERLKRPKKDGETEDREIQDLFADRASLPPPASVAPPPAVVAKPAPPPPPSAPPLPFKYLGRMVDGDAQLVFLERNQAALSAAAGDRLDNHYRVESIAESAVHFIYLPLGAKQVLSIPAQHRGTTP